MIKYLNIYYWVRKISVSQLFQLFFSKKFANKVIFNSIYKSNHWNRSVKFNEKTQSLSGPGSAPELIQTKSILKSLKDFFDKEKVKKVLDAPCGDCAWIKPLFKEEIEYTGVDIVDELIDKNITKFYEYKNVTFIKSDLTEFKAFDNYDFVFLRDFFIHLPFSEINKILKNLRESSCKYYCFNSYEDTLTNKDINTGQHRKLNFVKEPFFLPTPFNKILESKDNKTPDQNYLYIYRNENS